MMEVGEEEKQMHEGRWKFFYKPIWLLPGGFTFSSLVNSENHKRQTKTQRRGVKETVMYITKTPT